MSTVFKTPVAPVQPQGANTKRYRYILPENVEVVIGARQRIHFWGADFENEEAKPLVKSMVVPWALLRGETLFFMSSSTHFDGPAKLRWYVADPYPFEEMRERYLVGQSTLGNEAILAIGTALSDKFGVTMDGRTHDGKTTPFILNMLRYVVNRPFPSSSKNTPWSTAMPTELASLVAQEWVLDRRP